MAWFSLILAGVFEMLGVLMIGRFYEKRNGQSILLLVLSFGISFLLLSVAMETLPMGIAYSIWTGIGASGGAILGMIYFNESKDWKRLFFIAIIISAVVGLKLVST